MLHPAILLPADAQAWEREDLNRALMHELEHVRRGDIVSHPLARAVCAVYWFHPLVWMAWWQLVLEAERSCDDAVIARWEATGYADQLVGLARRLLAAAKSPVLAMANRSDLVIRVGAILDTRQRRGHEGRLVVAFGCAAATVLVLTMSPLRTISESRSTQIATGPAAPSPSFEVATIKPDRSGDTISGAMWPAGHYSATNVKIKGLIEFAYNVQDFQLSGGPSWIASERFDVDAKIDDSLVAEFNKLSFWQRADQMRLMVRSLLADRFSLRLKHKTEIFPIYALVIAKTGAKLQESNPNENYPDGAKKRVGDEGEFSMRRGQITAQGFSIKGLVWLLSGSL
ncbi:MAG: TIGR03435 family protein, partial [Candidatus Dormibacteraceae bacterium]